MIKKSKGCKCFFRLWFQYVAISQSSWELIVGAHKLLDAPNLLWKWWKFALRNTFSHMLKYIPCLTHSPKSNAPAHQSSMWSEEERQEEGVPTSHCRHSWFLNSLDPQLDAQIWNLPWKGRSLTVGPFSLVFFLLICISVSFPRDMGPTWVSLAT